MRRSSQPRAHSGLVVLVGLLVTTSFLDPARAAPATRPSGEGFLGVGFGNAVCDDKKPADDCVVGKAGAAFAVGGTFRFHPHFAVGGEIALNSFNANDKWRGRLTDPSTDVSFSSWYFAPMLRWYWFDHGVADPYLQAGFGFAAFNAKASNATDTYRWKVSGWTLPLAIGVDFHLGDHFRLGPQLGTYLLRGTRTCETPTNGDESCRDATRDERLLVWRFLAVGTLAY